MKENKSGLLYGYKDILIEYFNYVIAGSLLILIIVVMTMMVQLADNSRFAEGAGRIISRYGGYTPDAVIRIKDYSDRNYGGRYTIVSEETGTFPLGTRVDFTIEMKLKVLFFVDYPMTITYQGSTTTKARVHE